MMTRWLLIGLLCAAPAFAANKGCPTGSFAAQSATGASADSLAGQGASLAIQSVAIAGTATVIVEMSCDNGAHWAKVANSDMAITTTTSLAVSVLAPVCRYRPNVTVCAGCNVSVFYACGK
jgi:hypothetical protein